MAGAPLESVIAVNGKVVARPVGQENEVSDDNSVFLKLLFDESLLLVVRIFDILYCVHLETDEN